MALAAQRLAGQGTLQTCAGYPRCTDVNRRLDECTGQAVSQPKANGAFPPLRIATMAAHLSSYVLQSPGTD